MSCFSIALCVFWRFTIVFERKSVVCCSPTAAYTVVVVALPFRPLVDKFSANLQTCSRSNSLYSKILGRVRVFAANIAFRHAANYIYWAPQIEHSGKPLERPFTGKAARSRQYKLTIKHLQPSHQVRLCMCLPVQEPLRVCLSLLANRIRSRLLTSSCHQQHCTRKSTSELSSPF